MRLEGRVGEGNEGSLLYFVRPLCSSHDPSSGPSPADVFRSLHVPLTSCIDYLLLASWQCLGRDRCRSFCPSTRVLFHPSAWSRGAGERQTRFVSSECRRHIRRRLIPRTLQQSKQRTAAGGSSPAGNTPAAVCRCTLYLGTFRKPRSWLARFRLFPSSRRRGRCQRRRGARARKGPR